MIDLYSAATPNGWKASIGLEEFGLDYELHRIDLGAGDQKEPDYLKINPNGRIPAIVDREAENFAVFESGAILVYLAEKTGQLMPSDPKGRSVAMQWLMFQMAGIGPMQGQANYFNHAAAEVIPFAIRRYRDETRRLYEVLEARLAEAPYLAGAFSIADIAMWPWVSLYALAHVKVDDLPNLGRWLGELAARPAFRRGIEITPLPQEVLDRLSSNDRLSAV